ncbi:MAG: hypothetical protein Q7S36_00435 [Candidatus Liptonbacteria bacterium]|nr:hypothetical protein [Candidatus Liptonbacteria bacterium]
MKTRIILTKDWPVYDALVEARKREEKRIFVPTGRIILRRIRKRR